MSRQRSALLLLLTSLLVACGEDQQAAPNQAQVREQAQVRRWRSRSLLRLLDRAIFEQADDGDVSLELVTVGGEQRPAILARGQASIRFPDLVIGPAARLELHLGIDDRSGGNAQAPVRCSVLIDDHLQPPVEVWRGRLDPRQPVTTRRWHPVSLELAAYRSDRVDLVLRTRPSPGRVSAWTAWARPVLRSAGRLQPLAQDPIGTREPVAELARMASPQQLTVPAAACLELSGWIRRAPGSGPGLLGPVRFVATADGEVLLSRRLVTRRQEASFWETVPLDALAGQTVELDLRIDTDRPAASGQDSPVTPVCEWRRALVSRRATVARRTTADGPNLLLIVVDALRADHLGLYGYPRQTSPTLDRMAANGLVFARAISQSSWTMPAVASLLTGRYPPEHGVVNGQGLDQRLRTLAASLQQAGITTTGISANPLISRELGFDRGFEQLLRLPQARADQVNDSFLSWLEEQQDLRWFAYLHYFDPHDPYNPPPATAGTFAGAQQRALTSDDGFRKLVLAVNFGNGTVKYSDQDIAALRDRYDEEILFWDQELERLVNRLQELALLEQTIIVITSDHGEEFLEHGRLRHGQHLYDESVRVPLILTGPGIAAAHRQEQVETRALYSTVLQLMGLGSSATPGRLLGQDPNQDRPTFSYTRHALLPERSGFGTRVMASAGDWKYISLLEQGSGELYNLRQDPAESSNLLATEPAVAARFQEALDAWLAGLTTLDQAESSRTAGKPAAVSQEALARLRALGYLEP